MENILLVTIFVLIVLVILAMIPASRMYGSLKDNVRLAIQEIQESLNADKELLRRTNQDYLRKYSSQDADPYGQKAQAYEKQFQDAYRRVSSSVAEHRRIRQILPRKGRSTLERIIGSLESVFRWIQADRDIYKLRLSIREHENDRQEVERALQQLDRLPLETADMAKATLELCLATKTVLEELSLVEGINGRTMQDSLKQVGEIEKSLALLNPIFFNATSEELLATPNIKSETQKAYRTLKPAKASLDDLNKKAKIWKSNLEDLRRTVEVMDEKMAEAESMDRELANSLTLTSEQEELDALGQKAVLVKSNLSALTVEVLSPTLGDAKETLAGLVNLTRTFKEYEEKLIKLRSLVDQITGQIETAETTMKAAATRQEYPLIWTNSRSDFEDVRGKFAFIPPLSEKRTPAELTANVLNAETCTSSLVKQLATINRVTANLDQLCRLWSDLKPLYTAEWLEQVKVLFALVDDYDMEQNWDPADRAKFLLSDAEQMKKAADQNIPASASLPIYEQQVAPRLQSAKELAEQKPVFDARKARIETGLGKVQADEKEAIGIFRRIAPAVTLFVQRIRSINISTKPAQAMLAADVKKQELEKSLRERNVGRVSTKLEEVRKWEKNTGESGAEVYKWVEDDLTKRRLALGDSLKEIRTFAEDLEDDVVVRAHQYELATVGYPLVVDLVEKKPLDAIQGSFAELFKTWQEVVECQGGLANFISPIQDEYRQIVVDLNNLQANCARLETELKRDWPPVFQTVQILRAKVDNLDRSIARTKSIKWKRNDLRKSYLDTWRDLQELAVEVDNMRRADRQEAEEMTRLEKDYRNSVREFSRRAYEGNEAMIRKEENAGEQFLKTTIEAYKAGRKSGTNDPSATEVRAQIQRKLESYKQRMSEYNISRMEVGRPPRLVEVDIAVPINKTEFVRNLDRLLADLQRIASPSQEVGDAIRDVQLARQEAGSAKPDPSVIRRCLNSAKVTLEAEKSDLEAATVVADIPLLTGTIKMIFGS